MIVGVENIAELFSIFHDGSIARATIQDDELVLEIAIQYLAERVDSRFRVFTLRLRGLGELEFETWPNEPKNGRTLMGDARAIFAADLDILQGAVVGERVQVFCNQASPDYDYCGGELRFHAASAEVCDEGGKSYSLEELGALATEYWEEWAKRGPSR